MDHLEHWKLRVLLLALLAVIVPLELRWAWTSARYIVSPQSFASDPSGNFDVATLTMTSIEPAAAADGLREGDVLLALDGRPTHSYADALRRFYQHTPGTRATMHVRHKDGSVGDVSLRVMPHDKNDWQGAVYPLVLNILTPLCCTGLGFLVALRRPRDPAALALLLLLLSMSFMMSANGNLRAVYPPFYTWITTFLSSWSNSSWPPAWLLFALLFPDVHSPHKRWPVLAWVLSVPLLLHGVLMGLWAALFVHGVTLRGWWMVSRWLPDGVSLVWTFAVITLGFINCFHKLRAETDPSRRRRLKWVIFGLSAGIGPVSLLLLSAALLHRDLNNYPVVPLAFGILTPLLLPITLAYAVLVDRVFDVGVFIRQSLLASWTALLATMATMTAFSYATYLYVSRRDISDGARAAGVGIALTGILVVNHLAARLRAWIDRRFFREAVNAEQMLASLVDDIRLITDTQTLLRTVSERVASALHVSSVVALVPADGGFVPACCFGCAPSDGEGRIANDTPVLAQLRERRAPVLIEAEARAHKSALNELGTELLLPLGSGTELHGVLGLGAKRSEEPYTKRDIRLLETVANQTALALEVSRLTQTVAEEAAQRERLHNEIEIASQVQQRLFPKAAPVVEGLTLAGACRPAETIGGDYYDFLVDTASGEIGLAIGDVAGKGVPAALLMAGLQASLRSLTVAGVRELSDLMAKLNLLVYDTTPSNRFATFFYGAYAPTTRQLRYSSAGHNPALLYRAATGTHEWLRTPGIGLGLRRHSSYGQAELELHAGDCLVLYTDGVTEARNVAGDEFGEDRLAEVVQRHAGASANALCDAVFAAVCGFAQGAPQHDDITVIVACVN